MDDDSAPTLEPGRVVILNGTSSAGKTTLAQQLQRRFANQGDCWVIIGIDDMFLKLPPEWVRVRGHAGVYADEGVAFDVVDDAVVQTTGPIGHRALAAYRGAVGATARAGLHVLVDEVLLSRHDHVAWAEQLEGLDTTWVGLRVDLAIVEARERDRGDRVLGLARSQHDLVHRFATYDLEVDTGALDAHAAADAVFAHLCRQG